MGIKVNYIKAFRKSGFRKIGSILGSFLGYQISVLTGRSLVFSKPHTVSIEPSSFCTLSCPGCPSGNKSLTRKRGNIDKDLFFSLINQIYRHVSFLTLYFQGEPYLHPEFFELCRYASRKGMMVTVSTNAQNLSYHAAEQTVESGVSQVIVSLDGLTQEEYEQYRVGGNVQKVYDALRYLRQARTEKKSKTPFITAQVLLLRSNENSLAAIREKAFACGADRVEFKTAQFYNDDEASVRMPENPRLSRYTRNSDERYSVKKKMKNRCRRLWSNPVITWDGILLPCCFDKDGTFPQADLKTVSFQEAWNGPAFKAFRERILHSRKNVHICTNCTE